MSNTRIINTFLALFSQEIAGLERIKGKYFLPANIELYIVDNLPSRRELIRLENDLLNMLAKQGWKISLLEISLQKPAIIFIKLQVLA